MPTKTSRVVDGVIADGGKYIKVVVNAPEIMGGGMTEPEILKEIVRYSHEKGLKVATHATTVAAYELAVDCGVDILIHIPMGEVFPAVPLSTIRAHAPLSRMPPLIRRTRNESHIRMR